VNRPQGRHGADRPPAGLLKALAKTVVTTALDEKKGMLAIAEVVALGEGPDRQRSKTIVTEAACEVQIEAPGDRDGTFTPQVVKKCQRRLADLDAVVISLLEKICRLGRSATLLGQR
jgi:transposase-like protein